LRIVGELEGSKVELESITEKIETVSSAGKHSLLWLSLGIFD